MRRILIENARRKKSLERGGNRQRVELDESILVGPQEIRPDELLALNDALEKLSEQDKTTAELIKLRIFAGVSVKRAAQMLGLSASKAYADLEYARAWLRLEMGKSDTTSSQTTPACALVITRRASVSLAFGTSVHVSFCHSVLTGESVRVA